MINDTGSDDTDEKVRAKERRRRLSEMAWQAFEDGLYETSAEDYTEALRRARGKNPADWIDDLERKAKAATPGPWVADHSEEDNSAVKQEGRTWWDGLAFCGRPTDAEFIAAANPTAILRLIEDLRRTKSGARTLGRIIEQQNRDALDASGMHHVVDETGDGDWEVVWEALALLRPERDVLRARLAAVEALADETERAGDPLLRLDHLRAALSAAPTDTTKETDR